MKKRKLLQKAIRSPANLRFSELCRLAEAFGFVLDRVSGSHHIFVHPDAERPLNIQSVSGQAKPYQVRQLLRDIEEFNLSIEDEP